MDPVATLNQAPFEPVEHERIVAALAHLDSSGLSEADRAQRRSAAASLVSMHLDVDTVVATLLVGVCDPDEPPKDSTSTAPLSAEACKLLEGVARLHRIRWDRLDDEGAEGMRRMFLAMARDVRVVLIVLALRVEQMREVDALPAEAKARAAAEAMEIFAPLANRLGIGRFKVELEDGAFRILEPENFERLSTLLAQKRDERQTYIDEVAALLAERLNADGLRGEIFGRPKHLSSIFNKMRLKQIDFENLYDISALRVITERVPDCYAILGSVHAMWRPIRGEFDDYIAMPKPNGYQSLHTVVIGPRGRPVEVQIRTHEMHRFAEFGVAAHFAYKEKQRGGVVAERFMVLRRLLDWERELLDSKQFVESLKTDVFADQVYVFTPTGDVVDLPKGATPLDFAYRIHTSVGHRTRGARVNDQIVTLDRALQTGDRVQILTHKEPQPSRDWMNPNLGYLKTAGARAKVRHWFRQQSRDAAITAGKDLLERELRRLGLRRTTAKQMATAMGYAGLEEMFAAIGYGDRSPQAVASTALELEHEHEPPPPPSHAPSSVRGTSGLRLDGIDDVLGKRARCCNPLPGDSVIGFVTRGRGVVIHRRDCANVLESPEPERLVEVDWGPDQRQAHSVSVEVSAAHHPELLSRVVKVLTSLGITVRAARVENDGDSDRLSLDLETRSAHQLTTALERLGQRNGIDDVRVV